ncbi:EAL domain-containing protein [Lachnospira pectinoschiza]|uniref:Diguanylate cyclase (GGDEF) domain-containing protein n=1 Tax=Lachnospira pectinoschiza TaxID=28052 RepID=A0A1G9WSP3_9FIRM|nr:EAL domain-containing protein [Lachnospira pectinoschiza]SDM87427.1 diguanylate cyclase (GGDEF) domain-containing protein [Lachnospira pectinoschiza]
MTNDELRDYVVKNIDLAIEKAYIVPFYQPVIRSVTGKLCGFEALARWIDPEMGMISPAIFVPALEAEGLIYKLDFYMLESVCRDFVRHKERKGNAIPFSLNLSRQDFYGHEVAEVIENSIRKHNVPRNMLNLEITESIIGKDPDYMRGELAKLHNLGYSIWMDDFGSEYSSFNVLKDFEFDELKIDMKFLFSNDLKAKKIVIAIVDMAKKIGIRTLAEGVETYDQYEFLRNIGCEKIQGYLFSKPMNFNDTCAFVENYDYGCETAMQANYYDEMCSVNILSSAPIMGNSNDEIDDLGFKTQLPITIAEIKDERIKFIFYNETFEKQLIKLGIGNMAILDSIIKDKDSSYYKKVMEICNLADSLNGDYASGNFIIDDKLCIARVYKLSQYEDTKAYACVLISMIDDDEYLKKITKDRYMDSLLNKYDRVDLFDLSNMTDTEVYVNDQNKFNYDGGNVFSNMDLYIKENVFYDDVPKYLRFFEMSTLRKRIERSEEHIIAEYLRIKEGNTYVWKIMECTYIGNNKVVATLRNASNLELNYAPFNTRDDNPLNNDRTYISFGTIRENAISYLKDTNLRYKDVTKAFLEFGNFKSKEDIIGKSDEEINWIESFLLRKMEEKAIAEGTSQSIVENLSFNNDVKTIVLSVIPTYNNGKCMGVIGFLKEMKVNNHNYNEDLFIDSYSGLYNTRGLMTEVNNFMDEFCFNNRKFAVILIDIKDFRYIIKNYGNDFSKELIVEVANILKKNSSITSIIGRFEMDHFLMATYYDDEKEILELKEKILSDIHKIKKISNKSFTSDAIIEYTTCLEEDTAERMVSKAYQKIAQIKSNRNGE